MLKGSTCITLAQHLGGTKGLSEAEASCRTGLSTLQELVDEWPHNPEYRRFLAHCHGILGEILWSRQQMLEAASNSRRALEIYEGMDTEARDLGGQDELADAYNQLACILADVDPRVRDIPEAVHLAERAVKLYPKNWECWNALGIVRYRAAAWKPATEALDRSMALHSGGDASDWLILAMARWQLGERKSARDWYDKAVAWIEKNKPKDEQLLRLRDEATGLLARSTDHLDCGPARGPQPAGGRRLDTPAQPTAFQHGGR
jgi:tetratricopeptide (TPR) repeat protein